MDIYKNGDNSEEKQDEKFIQQPTDKTKYQYGN